MNYIHKDKIANDDDFSLQCTVCTGDAIVHVHGFWAGAGAGACIYSRLV